MHPQIVNWIRNANLRHIYLRDQNPDYEALGPRAKLNSVYKKRCLATTTIVDVQVPCGHALRTSYLHIMSTGAHAYPLEHSTFDIMLFDELFQYYFQGRCGAFFAGGSDGNFLALSQSLFSILVHNCKKFVAEPNYKFVFEDNVEQGGHLSDERLDDSSRLGW
jgi:hypothetical protein